jgi:hypothetical protein
MPQLLPEEVAITCERGTHLATVPALPLVEHCLERSGEAGNDQCGRVRARDDDGLLVQCGEDVLDQPCGRPRCLRTYQRHESAPSGFADRGG